MLDPTLDEGVVVVCSRAREHTVCSRTLSMLSMLTYTTFVVLKRVAILGPRLVPAAPLGLLPISNWIEADIIRRMPRQNEEKYFDIASDQREGGAGYET